MAIIGEITIPGDKSITHRAIMFNGIARGVGEVFTSLLGRDNFATLRAMRQLGVVVKGKVSPELAEIANEEGFSDLGISSDNNSTLQINGLGIGGLKTPTDQIDCGNSGTTARLLTGILAASSTEAILTGDSSLSKRPFKRVTEPLSKMGARFSGDMLPLKITGAEGKIKSILHRSQKPSAQVKSAVLLAGLCGDGVTEVYESIVTRDHTEQMFKGMGIAFQSGSVSDLGANLSAPFDISQTDYCVKLEGGQELTARRFEVPGDFSSASFFIVLASIVPGSDLLIKRVNFNPTRIGLYNILKKMGADIVVERRYEDQGEEMVDLRVKGTELKGVEVDHSDVVYAIDEIPILSVAMSFAKGESRITGAEELRVKESDRLTMTRKLLQTYGIQVEELPDGLIVNGDRSLLFNGVSEKIDPVKTEWGATGDHRISMTAAVLSYVMCDLSVKSEKIKIAELHAVQTSFPNFLSIFNSLIG